MKKSFQSLVIFENQELARQVPLLRDYFGEGRLLSFAALPGA
jgi:hypothetical protein